MIHRRRFLSGAAVLAASDETPPARIQYVELGFYHVKLHQAARLHEWASQRLLPLLKKSRFGPAGVFGVVVGPQDALVGALCHQSLTEREAAWNRLTSDPEWSSAVEAFESGQEGLLDRADTMLLRLLPYSPEPIFVSAPKSQRRFLELRIYHLPGGQQGRVFHRFFAEHAVRQFRKHKLAEVFYGECVIGAGMPTLAYMLAFDTWADREKAWAAFSADPEWGKASQALMKESPISSARITNMILRPTAYSPIQ